MVALDAYVFAASCPMYHGSTRLIASAIAAGRAMSHRSPWLSCGPICSIGATTSRQPSCPVRLTHAGTDFPNLGLLHEYGTPEQGGVGRSPHARGSVRENGRFRARHLESARYGAAVYGGLPLHLLPAPSRSRPSTSPRPPVPPPGAPHRSPFSPPLISYRIEILPSILARQWLRRGSAGRV